MSGPWLTDVHQRCQHVRVLEVSLASVSLGVCPTSLKPAMSEVDSTT